MLRSDFHFDLPPELIAQAPLPMRSASRLLCLDGATGAIENRRFADLPSLLRAGDLLVLNNTRVLPARLFGQKDTGGRVELLLERLLDDQRGLFQCRASKPMRNGARVAIEGGGALEVIARQEAFIELRTADGSPLAALLDRAGHMPLPPYIARSDELSDRERYQTVFARVPGAVAAPTAGLHFDDTLLAQLRAQGVGTTEVTLHVGAGTFQPLRVERIEDHHMHGEQVEVSRETCERIAAVKAAGGRVIAVGTTAVRALETAAQGATTARDGALQPFRGETALFITPGYRFRVVDALVTNFHLPESTLLMLVCAFAGTDAVLRAYRHAVAERYRFFSYGDAMFILPAPGARGLSS